VYSDLREGKKTVLVIYSLSKLSSDEGKKLMSTLGKRDASIEELKSVAELIKSTGAVEFADSLADKYLKQGLEALSRVRPVDQEARDLLRDLALFVAARNY
ncbi:MAG: polyprenyl synthetase family protein, partial [Zestosphaera sp.]